MAKSFDNYAQQLEKLLDAAREATIGGDDRAMKASHRALNAFIAESDDRIPGVEELDKVANAAMQDVTLARLDQTLVKNLSERSGDVASLVKTFSKQAAVNDSTASTLRLERVKAVLNAGTTAVGELKKLADTVDETTVDGKKLAKAVNDAIEAVQRVHGQLAGAC